MSDLHRARLLLLGSALLSLTLTACGGAPVAQKTPTTSSARPSLYPHTGRYTPIYMLKQYEGESEPLLDMSGHGGEEDTQEDTAQYHEREEPVLYWTDADRQAHQLRVKEGLLVNPQGQPLDPQLDLPQHKGRGGEAIYIMDVMGNIYYCFDAKYGRIHHSTLAGGQPVAAAGELVVVNGELISVSNESGHYRPHPSTIDLVIGRLRELGLNVEGVKRFELLPKEGAPEPERLKPHQED